MKMNVFPTKNCFNHPSKLIRFVVLFTCAIFTVGQVIQCFAKFIHPPTATYSHFILNDSIRYPCVTVCRRPSYKTEELANFGIHSQSLESSFAFKYFNFSKHSLTELLEKATYNYKEMFFQYAYASKGGSDSSNELIKLTSMYRIDRGRCFTIQPLQMSNIFSVSGGYMFFLKHNVTSQSMNEYGISTHGYQFYLHDPNEILTADDDERNNFLEYLDLEASEDMRIKFEIQEYSKAPTKENDCIDDRDYSRSKCEEMCVNQQIAKILNCTVPWMLLPENETFDECNNYKTVKLSIKMYTNQVIRDKLMKNCSCPISCNFTVYKTSVISRRPIEPVLAPNCVICFYCTNLVFKMSEVFGYDSNQLVADIGGSLGFLLGLSVLSLICLLEEVSKLIFRIFFKGKIQNILNKEVQPNNQQIEDKILKEKMNLAPEYANITNFVTQNQNCDDNIKDNIK